MAATSSLTKSGAEPPTSIASSLVRSLRFFLGVWLTRECSGFGWIVGDGGEWGRIDGGFVPLGSSEGFLEECVCPFVSVRTLPGSRFAMEEPGDESVTNAGRSIPRREGQALAW